MPRMSETNLNWQWTTEDPSKSPPWQVRYASSRGKHGRYRAEARFWTETATEASVDQQPAASFPLNERRLPGLARTPRCGIYCTRDGVRVFRSHQHNWNAPS